MSKARTTQKETTFREMHFQERNSFMEKVAFYAAIIGAIMVMALSGCRENVTKRRAASQAQGRIIKVPGDYATPEEALRVATRGDKVILGSGYFQTSTGFVFPAGIDFRGTIGSGVRPATVIDYIGSARVPIAELGGDDIVVEGITFTSSGGAATHAVHGVAIKNVTIWSCAFEMDGVLLRDTENVSISGSTFILPQTTTAPSAGTSTGIIIGYSSGIVVRGNTMVGYTTDVAIHDSDSTLIENNIIMNAQSGVQMDDYTSRTSTIEYNCFWANRFDLFNSNQLLPIAMSAVGNIVQDPQFVSLTVGDLRLMPSSPCAAGGRTGGWIGAREIFGVVSSFISPQSPVGTLQRGQGIEVLRIKIVAGDQELRFFGLSWAIDSTPPYRKANIQVVERDTGKTIFDTSYPIGGGSGGIIATKIDPRASREYSVYMDTTTSFSQGDIVKMRIGPYVEENGTSIYLPQVTGNPLTF